MRAHFGNSVYQLTILCLLSACGEEATTPPGMILPVHPPAGDTSAPVSSSPSNTFSTRVFANLDFQPSGISVTPGKKFVISATGQVSVGHLTATNPNTPNQVISKYYVGIKGGRGGSLVNNTYVPPAQPFGAMIPQCGVQASETLQNLKNNGTQVEVSAASYVTYGPCCGSVARGIQNPYSTTGADLFNGNYRYVIEKNSCAPNAPIASLIMKIVPKGARIHDFAVVAVGDAYMTTPYVANAEGELYFATNDIYRHDNAGSWDVTVNLVP